MAVLRLFLALGAVLLACSQSAPEPPPAPEAAPPPDAGPPSVAELSATLPDAEEAVLDAERAAEFVALSLHCADREYPNKPGDVVVDDRSVKPPRELHPAFFGCYDWHSSVHGHWAMVRVLRRFPDVARAEEMRALLNAHLAPERMAVELSYFQADHHKTFERPYGWGWFFRLRAALHESRADADHQRWLAATEPLAQLLRTRLLEYLDRLTVPIRVGTHANTAYALVHIRDYATTVADRELVEAIDRGARRFYQADRNCPTAYEPSGEDFISPCLVEADLMRRVLPGAEFSAWLDGFLPAPGSREFAPLLRPTEVRDKEDPRIGHLIGLAFQRAASYDGIASALPEGDERRALFQRLARNHRRAGIDQMFDSGYGGAHWLASFAIYTLTGVGLPAQ